MFSGAAVAANKEKVYFILLKYKIQLWTVWQEINKPMRFICHCLNKCCKQLHYPILYDQNYSNRIVFGCIAMIILQLEKEEIRKYVIYIL
jgi:hypothetical protein